MAEEVCSLGRVALPCSRGTQRQIGETAQKQRDEYEGCLSAKKENREGWRWRRTGAVLDVVLWEGLSEEVMWAEM